MNLTRFFCFFLAFLFLVPLVGAASSVPNTAQTVLDSNEPYILCDVGDEVDLSQYGLLFEGSFAPRSDLTFTDEDGKEIFSLSPKSAGVTRLTASDGAREQAVYVVAKEKESEDYVLFELDLSTVSSLSELEELGCALDEQKDRYALSDGVLEMGDLEADYTQLMLPEWLSDFPNCAFHAEAKFLETANDRRWFSLFLRAQNESQTRSPLYQYCIRENTYPANGLEFARQEQNGNWNVLRTGSWTIASLTDKFHDFCVESYGLDFRCSADEQELIAVTRTFTGSQPITLDRGFYGISVNCSRIALKSLRLTLQTDAPAFSTLDTPLLFNEHEPNNLRNPIANVQKIGKNVLEALSEAERVGVCLFDSTEADDLEAVLALCREKQIVPTVSVSTEGEADRLLDAVEKFGFTDLSAVSDKPEILRALRDKNANVRTGLFLTVPEGEFTRKTADELRRAVRGAPATFCILNAESATREVVSSLQKLAVSVWVEVDTPSEADTFTVSAARALTSGANGVITDDARRLTDTLNRLFVPNTMTRLPLIIGHRAAPVLAPENSLSGCLAAYENGADLLELDAALTADGEVILLHDNTLNRTTDYEGDKQASEMTLEEIKQYNLRARDGTYTEEKVPTLREVLEAIRGKDVALFLECKGDDATLVEACAEIILEMDMTEYVNVISFTAENLAAAQAAIPGISVGHVIGADTTSWTQAGALYSLAPLLADAQANASSLNPVKSVFTVLFEEAATDRGMTVWPYTYNYADSNSAFLSACDGMTTDDPQWAKDMAKLLTVESESFAVYKDEAASLSVFAETFGGAKNELDPKNLLITVIDGEELVRVEDGAIYANENAEGTATLLFGYRTTTARGGDYVIYSEPVTLAVQPSASTLTIVLISLGGVLLIAGGTVTCLAVSKKKKQKAEK